MDISREEWRDSIDASGLTPKARAVAMKMTDFWKPESVNLWNPIDLLVDRTGLSRATVYRALDELQQYGYLLQIEKFRQHRSPRYLPLLAKKGSGAKADKAASSLTARIQRSQDENPEVSKRDMSPYRVPTEPPPGSQEQDCESRASFDAQQMTAAQKSDRRKLSSYMANYPSETVDLVYGWMRTGFSVSGRPTTVIGRPGAYAANKSKIATEVPGVSEWQGHFLRHYVKNGNQDYLPTTAASADPWATSKSA